jgi:pimeloyl-ACP methyl ester carboxylesterase
MANVQSDATEHGAENGAGSPEAVRIVVTLVHGTFARAAAWTADDSDIASALGAHFDDLVIARYEWSGDNDVMARIRAEDHLREHLTTLQQQYPFARQYLIGHSHGGNIAVRAATTRQLDINVQGVACLGTPFIAAEMRDLSAFPWRDFYAGIGLSAAIIAFFAARLVGFGFAITSLAMGVSALGFVSIARELFAHIPDHQKAALQIMAGLMTTRALPGSNLLIIRSLGDEASLLLSTTQFLSWASVRAFSIATAPRKPGESPETGEGGWWPQTLRKAWFPTILLTLVGLGAYSLNLPFALEAMQVGLFSAVCLGTTLAGRKLGVFDAVGSSFCCVGLLLSTALISYAVGNLPELNECKGRIDRWVRGFTRALFIDVTVEPTPLGRWYVHQLYPCHSRSTLSGYKHSIYEHPAVPGLIVEWIARSEELDVW